jgi:hypothetical protein
LKGGIKVTGIETHSLFEKGGVEVEKILFDAFGLALGLYTIIFHKKVGIRYVNFQSHVTSFVKNDEKNKEQAAIGFLIVGILFTVLAFYFIACDIIIYIHK